MTLDSNAGEETRFVLKTLTLLIIGACICFIAVPLGNCSAGLE